MSLKAPAALSKDIITYITRSNELETPEPLISYFCKLYAVEQILNLGLHTGDDSISTFAMVLLDSIESFKANPENSELVEIINDKETSIAYVISFANSIFKNSLNQIVNQKSTKGTAMSLLTSTQFFKLLSLWSDRYEELEESEQLTKKVKYAKFHASRILKAFKNGENPNDYIPPVNDTETGDLLKEESFSPNVEQTGSNATATPSAADISKSTESLPLVDKPEVDELGLPSAPKSIGDDKEDDIPLFVDEETQTDEPPVFVLPSTPQEIKTSSEAMTHKTPEPEHHEIDVNQIIETGEVYAKATKHSKFAISAMNYEDTKTAIKELEAAISLLKTLKE
ncbi:hypothetical protein WICPIJ_004221 [Wickerhamomyces pijperi]|uniref:Vacuolar protein sorting-associated protein VTA1 n=1 Tax=Wickerhamomyces pijperi TaxID=599730 RepID=A0A9P8Q6A4_WICPI|nr:hypothetical protein WICPIJ_004221 [Wickerhamomyces pijperi]